MSYSPHITRHYGALCLALAVLTWSCGDTVAGGDDQGSTPRPGEDGAACQSSDDCFGGVCLTELESGLPSGYCTAYDCTQTGCFGGVCREQDGRSACLDGCRGDADCRNGYACIDFGGARFCDFAGVVDIDVGESPAGACVYGCEAGDPVRIDCGFTPSRALEGGLFQWGLPYQLTVGIDGFALSVWPEQGRHSINLVSATNGAGAHLWLKGADAALNVTSFFDNEFATTIVPFAPQYESFVDSPTGLLQIQSTAASVCLARSEGTEGDELDLQVYLVGAGGLRAFTLGADPDFQRMLAELRRLFALSGIGIGHIVPHDAGEQDVEAYRFIRTEEDIRGVLALTQDPTGADGDANVRESLVLNLVMVDDIMLTDGTDTIGQAGLLPGPPGVHGMGVSGVLVETAGFRDDPEYLALIVAHEGAHYLGLRHTTEMFEDPYAFGRTDPLADTPECPDVPALLEGCPDYFNLMFPLAPMQRDASRLELSADQGWVLRRNPLVR